MLMTVIALKAEQISSMNASMPWWAELQRHTHIVIWLVCVFVWVHQTTKNFNKTAKSYRCKKLLAIYNTVKY